MSGDAMQRTSSSKGAFAFWNGELDGDIDPVDWFWRYWVVPEGFRVMRVSVRWENVCNGYIAFGVLHLPPVGMPVTGNICLICLETPLGVTDFTWIGGRGYECKAGDIFAIEVDSTVLPNHCYVSWLFEQI